MAAVPTVKMPSRRLLVRGVNWLGDAVMTTAAIQRLREAMPSAHVALLAHEKLAGLWQDHPALDELITFNSSESVLAVANRVRSGKFDTALILPNSPRSALEAWLARVPRRIGYSRPWRNWFLSIAVPARSEHVPMKKRTVREIQELVKTDSGQIQREPSDTAHQLHEYLHLVAVLGANPAPIAPLLHIQPQEIASVRTKFFSEAPNAGHQKSRTGNPILLGLNPGAEFGPAKRWPTERFAAVARHLVATNPNILWIAFGGKNDQILCEEIGRQLQSPLLNLAGRTSLRELMALLKLCRVLVTNDTGPMHVAAALGTPVVVPFGSTSPILTGPGLPKDPRHRLLRGDAPCSPCFLRSCPIDFRCMTSISHEQVINAVLEVISQAG